MDQLTSQTKVLIVDDNKVNLRIIHNILSKNGYDSLPLNESKRFFETLDNFKLDLILLDINMPTPNGLEICKKLQSDKKLKSLSVIFVTANTDAATLQKAFEAGGIDYITKPVNKIELLARLKSVLAQQELLNKINVEERLRGVIEMSGAICHELNQPLQVITGLVDIVLWEMPKDSPHYNKLSKLRDQAFRLGSINQKLMKITKYETKEYLGRTRIIDIDKAG